MCKENKDIKLRHSLLWYAQEVVTRFYQHRNSLSSTDWLFVGDGMVGIVSNNHLDCRDILFAVVQVKELRTKSNGYHTIDLVSYVADKLKQAVIDRKIDFSIDNIEFAKYLRLMMISCMGGIPNWAKYYVFGGGCLQYFENIPKLEITYDDNDVMEEFWIPKGKGGFLFSIPFGIKSYSVFDIDTGKEVYNAKNDGLEL